jgi:hypothetical protein
MTVKRDFTLAGDGSWLNSLSYCLCLLLSSSRLTKASTTDFLLLTSVCVYILACFSVGFSIGLVLVTTDSESGSRDLEDPNLKCRLLPVP